MNGAFAYKQVGEYDKAIEMYELFISRYGNEKTLGALKNGDAKAKPPVAAQPKKYEERVEVPAERVRRVGGRLRAVLQLPARGRDVRQDQQQPELPREEPARVGASGPVAVRQPR